jgi:hypothetical protein
MLYRELIAVYCENNAKQSCKMYRLQKENKKKQLLNVIIRGSLKQHSQRTYNVIPSRVHETTVAVEKQ